MLRRLTFAILLAAAVGSTAGAQDLIPHGRRAVAAGGDCTVQSGSLEMWLPPYESDVGSQQTWTDATGNGHSPTQADSDKRPTTSGTLLNGYYGLLGDGINDALVTAASVLLSSEEERTWIVVLANVAAVSASVPFGHFAGAEYARMADVRSAGTGAIFAWTSALNADTDPHVLSLTVDHSATPDSADSWLDGTDNGSGTDTTSISDSVVSLFGDDAGTRNANVILYEVMLWSSHLSTEDRESVESCLTAKYGLGALVLLLPFGAVRRRLRQVAAGNNAMRRAA